MEGLQGPRCPSCGEMWVGGSTVTCEGCGADLQAGRQPESGGAGAERASSTPWWRSGWAAVVALFVVALAVVEWTVGLPGSDDAPDAVGPGVEQPGVEQPGVEQPDAEAPDASSPPPDPFVEVPEPGMTHCSVDDCELWRFELPGEGSLHVEGGLLVHTTWGDQWPALPDQEEGAAEEQSRTITVVDLADGEMLWQDDVLVGASGAQGSVRVAGDLLLVPAADGLTAHDLADGTSPWTVGFRAALFNARRHGTDVVLLGEVEQADDVQGGDSPGEFVPSPQLLVRVDGETGEPVWRLDDVRVAAWGDDHVVVEELGAGALATVDLHDGTILWRHAVAEGAAVFDGSVRAWADAGRLMIAEGRDLAVLDVATGEPVVEIDDGVPSWVTPRLVGPLLVLDRSERMRFGTEQVTPAAVEVIHLDDPDREVFRTDDAVDTAQVFEAGHAPREGPAAPTGMAVLSHDGDTYHLVVVDTSGELRWDRHWDEQACCWAIAPGSVDGTVAIVPADLEEEPVRLLDVTDGETVFTYELPVETTRVDHANWSGPLVMLQRQTGRTTWTAVVGPEGWFAVATDHEGVQFRSLSPVPIVQEGWELIALDRDVLLGDEAALSGGS